MRGILEPIQKLRLTELVGAHALISFGSKNGKYYVSTRNMYIWRKYFYILSVNEKLPVSKFRCFGKYIIQVDGYLYVHVSGQRQTGLEKKKTVPRALELWCT